jgi:phosphohistidine phosphatase
VRTLLLLRHGKSDWNVEGDDRDRPLAPRGQRAAATIGRFIARTGHIPASVITSPARRAHDTLRLAMEAGAWSSPLRIAEALYGGGVPALVDEARAESTDTGVLLVVGHEPTMSEAASLLTGGSRFRVPTGALIRHDFDADWSDVGAGMGVLAWSVVPRLLAES